MTSGALPSALAAALAVLLGTAALLAFVQQRRMRKEAEGRAQALSATLDGLRAEVAERRTAEARLRAELDEVIRIVAHSPAIICGIAPDGTTTFVNPAGERVGGYPAEELVGRSWWRTFYPGEAYRQVEALFEALAQGDVRDYEMVLRAKSGERRTILWTTISRSDEAGRLVEIIGFGNDVTERRRLEEQLRQSQKMEALGRLAGGVAHDFNNLLSVILGVTELMLRRLSPDDPLAARLARIRQAGERASSLTQQLLAFSRQQVLAPTILDVNAVIANLGEMLQRLIGEHITLGTSLGPGLWPVKADPGQIEQVIMNLTINARDAMPQGGRLNIVTRNVALAEPVLDASGPVPPGPYVLLTVSDTGHGMDSHTLARIFDPFFTTKERGKGTGLGLATVYGIVEQSRGAIRVSSTVGQGTTFEIYLPRAEGPAEAVRPPLPAEGDFHGAGTVLLVEDEDPVRTIAQEILEAYGYQVLPAPNGEEALRICREHPGPIHLLLTDIVMPGMDGREVAARAAEARPGLRILYISGYTDGTFFLDEPGAPFLAKPFAPQDLASKVHAVLAGKGEP
ncbi:ATP-binding protein [Nitrospira sp. Kam-Ns4a]